MNIAVTVEGMFFLRYRVYNLLGTALPESGTPIPMLAECFGEPFTVYSTNDFPGLHESTELTKVSNTHHLPLDRSCGILMNVWLVGRSFFLTPAFESIAEIASVDGGSILRQQRVLQATIQMVNSATGVSTIFSIIV